MHYELYPLKERVYLGQDCFAADETFSHLCHRTEYCIAASLAGEASTCSDVPAWPFQFGGARRSPAGTGSRAVHRWRCTVSTALHANEGHRPLWSSSSESWAYICKHRRRDKGLNVVRNTLGSGLFPETTGITVFFIVHKLYIQLYTDIYLWSPLHILEGTLVAFVSWQ